MSPNLKANFLDSLSFGIGISLGNTVFSPEIRVPAGNELGIQKTPHVFLIYKKHEIAIGADIYSAAALTNKYFSNQIYGLQLNYRYHLLNATKKIKLFTETNLQYAQFGTGSIGSVGYHYTNGSANEDYNVIQSRSFVNTYGLGLRYMILTRLGIQLSYSAGYNYFKSNYSPNNLTEVGIYKYYARNKFAFISILKLGVVFKFK